MNAAVRTDVATWWQDLGRTQRFGLVGGAVAVLVAAAVFAWISLKSDFVPLTGELSKDDTAAVVAQLEDIRARYQVDAATGAVLVPAGEVDSIRAQLAQKGWPLKAAAGFELFDSGDFGMTEFTERINYQRALEGELARTIMSLDTVRYARVHLVLPQSSLFKKSNEPPKASVLLIGHRPDAIGEAQIAGIQRMVASAVPELKAENVSVHNQKGIELTGGAGGGLSAAAVDAEIRAQSDVEDYLSAKAQDILGRVFPKGTATVSVNAVLSRSQISSTRDEVLPAGQGAAAVSRIRSDALPDGVQGTPRAARESVAKQDATNPQFDVEYRIGHLSEQSESMPGGIERLTIGIVIPDPASQGLSINDVRELVSAGIGLQPERGDRIAVYAVASLSRQASESGPQGTSQAPNAGTSVAEREYPRPYWVLWLGVACLLVAIVLALRWPRREARLTASEREAVLKQVQEWLRQ